MKFIAGLLCLVVLILELELACLAAESWQSVKLAADALQKEGKYLDAIESYKRVLDLLPADQLAMKTKVEVLLAADLMQLKMFDEALLHGNKVLQLCRELNGANAITPDLRTNVLMLTMMRSSPRSKGSMEYEKRHTIAQKFSQLQIELKEALSGKVSGQFGAHMDVARGFVALSKDDKAEQELQLILKSNASNSPNNLIAVRSAIAGIKKKHGDPSASEKLLSEFKKNESETEALRDIAEGEFWAADYQAAKATVEKARKALDKAKPSERNGLEIELTLLNAKICGDYADNAEAEIYYRQALALGRKYNIQKTKLAIIEKALVSCLKVQHRIKAARSVKTQMNEFRGPNKHVLILTEAEKASLRKTVNKKQDH